ncbi:MAG: Uma2 family endonuclease [Pirellulaceae bacterium]|nr:Uma2 family endonuclease [Pirellulaceae bacterium]
MSPVSQLANSWQGSASQLGEPTWEVTEFFPRQENWNADEYLALNVNRLVELVDGRLEVLPIPTITHQLIVKFLCSLLEAYLQEHPGGAVLFAPLPVQLSSGTYREPDLVYLSARRLAETDKYPAGADLVVEVLSEGEAARQRDLVIKRREYAQAGIAEYWIIDPQQRSISVLTLKDSEYREAGVYEAGQTARSLLLAGFAVELDAVFRAADIA